jgi:hypothetical protein
MELEQWNPHTGVTEQLEIVEVIQKEDSDYTRFRLKLEPVKSLFLLDN